jgi:hypothetical protein
MLIWGGLPEATGGRYDPANDSWDLLEAGGEPAWRYGPNGVWTGSEMIVWGGEALSAGGLYRIQDIDRDGICNLDDNCPIAANIGQTDNDADGPGDACDNCAATPNPAQADADGDGSGDDCDPCPLDRDDDADVDGLCADVDQCPGDPENDLDSDGQCGDVDCDPEDPNDLRPPAVAGVLCVTPAPGTIELSWPGAAGADSYSVTRGELSGLWFGEYGVCVVEDLVDLVYSDPDPVAPGEGFIYLVQAVNDDCGLGWLGTDSTGRDRSVWTGELCSAPTPTDATVASETTLYGSIQGGFEDTWLSDDAVQSIVEETTSGNPSTRVSRLEHHWTLSIPSGSRVELHVEGFRTISPDNDGFVFDYSADDGASWQPIDLPELPLADENSDLVAALPSSLSGVVIVRVRDTNREPGNADQDIVAVDQLFVRVMP